jgi:hypothetical protein
MDSEILIKVLELLGIKGEGLQKLKNNQIFRNWIRVFGGIIKRQALVLLWRLLKVIPRIVWFMVWVFSAVFIRELQRAHTSYRLVFEMLYWLFLLLAGYGFGLTSNDLCSMRQKRLRVQFVRFILVLACLFPVAGILMLKREQKQVFSDNADFIVFFVFILFAQGFLFSILKFREGDKKTLNSFIKMIRK